MRTCVWSLAVWLLSVPAAYPCSCGVREPLCATLGRPGATVAAAHAPAIFIGTAIERYPVRVLLSTGRYYRQALTRVQVTELYKGESIGLRQGAVVDFIAGFDENDCSVVFRVGEQYLVHARRNQEGKWLTSICDGTREISRVGHELRALNVARATPRRYLSPAIYGRAMDYTVRGAVRSRPLTGYRFLLSSSNLSREVITDADGNFYVDGLLHGTYKARLLTPGWQLISHGAVILTAACAELSVAIQQLSGSEGSPP